MGFRYNATWQDDATTLKRLGKGVAFVAECEGRVVGTATLYLPPYSSGCAWYGRADVAHFGQFAVDPEFQRQGIGSRLLAELERETRGRGIANLALDTAEGAVHLIALYERRGYEVVELVDWKSTNYRSVVMNRALGDGPESGL